jgi:hypothetical protein
MTVNSAGCGRAAVEQRHGDVVPSQRLSWLMASPMSLVPIFHWMAAPPCPGERGAVVRPVVDEDGISESHPVHRQPRPEECLGALALERPGLAGADDVIADDRPGRSSWIPISAMT